MRGEVDALDFILAEQWGCTLAEVRALPAAEVEEWRSWRVVRTELDKIRPHAR